MTDKADLRATFDARWAELALGQTAVAPGATIRPAAPHGTLVMTPEPRTAETLDALPRITLDDRRGSLDARGAQQPHRTGDFEIRSTLGEGGMGRVHLARQRSLGRDVAVKTLKENAPARARDALLGEGLVTGQLEHPGIVPVHALGVDDQGRPVLVMKRIEGVSWLELARDAQHLVWRDLPGAEDRLGAHLEILMQVCNALHFAHSRGVVHRDVKPENVMVGRYGEVYLVDWGVATRLGGSGPPELVGSPSYMAPELVTGEAPGADTDVYLLGATLHEVLTGAPRHGGTTLQQVMLAAFRSAPVQYDDAVPAELAALCNRATERERSARPATALAFRQALGDFVRHRASIALGQAARERLIELEARLETAPARLSADELAQVYRLSTECRFGFAEALRGWAENDGAARGRDECLSLMIDFELRQGNAGGARALLSELGRAAPELTERLGELERTAALREERARALDVLERDQDETVGARQRNYVLAVMGVIGLGIGIFALTNEREMQVRQMVGFALAVALAAAIALAFLRRSLLGNAFGRRVVGVFVALILGLLLNRLVSLWLDASVRLALTHDLVLFGAVSAAAAVTLSTAFRWAALTYSAGLAASFVWPQHPGGVFSITTLVALIAVAAAWREARPKAD